MKEKGFTLVELMVAVTILVIIGGTAYTAFNMALDVYQRDATRMIMLQNVRIALNGVARDLGNVYLVEGENDLRVVTEDVPEEETVSHDIISFVSIVDLKPDQFVSQLSLTSEDEEKEELDEEEEESPESDVKRIFYYLKTAEPEEDEEEMGEEEIFEAEITEPTYSLIRATSAKLDLGEEVSLQEIIESGVIPPTTDEELEEGLEGTPLEEVVIAEHVTSLDFKYSDGEEWEDVWEEEERPPKAVQVIITVIDERGREKPATQSTMVFLTLSANFSEETEGMPEGGQEGGPGGPGAPGGPGG